LRGIINTSSQDSDGSNSSETPSDNSNNSIEASYDEQNPYFNGDKSSFENGSIDRYDNNGNSLDFYGAENSDGLGPSYFDNSGNGYSNYGGGQEYSSGGSYDSEF
jgi:hypothetical protein